LNRLTTAAYHEAIEQQQDKKRHSILIHRYDADVAQGCSPYCETDPRQPFLLSNSVSCFRLKGGASLSCPS
jgi:hypothetical protein